MTPITINIPVAIVFEQVGATLRAKPYPSYPTFTDIYVGTDVEADLTLINASLADHETRITAVEAAVITAQSTADTALTTATIAESQANVGIADAAVAYGLAETASIDAAAALALASSGGGARRATMWMDEAHYTVGTPTTLVGDAYLGNFIRYTTTNLAEFTFSFVSGDLNDGGIYLLCSKGSTSGIVEVRIDGTLVGTVDLYNATTLNNQFGLIGFGFGNPTFTAGYHKFSVKVNGKHASSSGWAAAFTKISIRTNAD